MCWIFFSPNSISPSKKVILPWTISTNAKREENYRSLLHLLHFMLTFFQNYMNKCDRKFIFIISIPFFSASLFFRSNPKLKFLNFAETYSKKYCHYVRNFRANKYSNEQLAVTVEKCEMLFRVQQTHERILWMYGNYERWLKERKFQKLIFKQDFMNLVLGAYKIIKLRKLVDFFRLHNSRLLGIFMSQPKTTTRKLCFMKCLPRLCLYCLCFMKSNIYRANIMNITTHVFLSF